MPASIYVLLASSIVVPASAARGEVLRMKCADAHGVLVVQYVIDTGKRQVDQNIYGGRLTHPVVVAVTEQHIRFVDRSGEARTDRTLHRLTGELVNEIMEGPERGVSFYMTCQKT